ncbi:MAG: hypothetical protein Rubg2KO_12380 [Rubricoccaceae bacterium]
MAALNLRPADFAVRYSWRAGSMPPPHHYRVSAEILPDGSGTATLTPGYSSKDVPTWSLPFRLNAEAFDALYTVLRLEGLFSADWRDPDRRTVGGSLWSVHATAEGQDVTVKGLQQTSDGARPTPIREAIWGAVPEGIRAELADRRKAYVAAYRKSR